MLSTRALLGLLVVVALGLALVNAKALAKLKPKIGKWDKYESGVYTDGYAREYMMPFAAAAYSDDPQTCVGRMFTNATVSRAAKLRVKIALSCLQSACNGASAFNRLNAAVCRSRCT